MKKFFFFLIPLIITALFFLGETSPLKAQENTTWFYVGYCDLHKNHININRCIACGEWKELSDFHAKCCGKCYLSSSLCLVGGCRNPIKHKIPICWDCATKDLCYAPRSLCGEYLGSGDVPTAANRDKRKVVERYTVQITIPGKKEEFMKYYNAANDAIVNKNYQEALDNFKKCNEIIPNGCACQVGIALKGLERYEEALSYFDVAFKEDPTWPDPYGEKGLTLIMLGRWNEAGQLLKKAIDLKTTDPVVFLGYGKFLEEIQKQPGEAIPYYEKIIAQNPTQSFKLYNNIGDIYFNQEKYDDAENAYKKVLEYDKNNFNALAFTGEIKFKKQNFEEALKYYLLAYELKPDNLELNFHMGICYAYSSQFEKAEKHFKHTLSINPKLSDVGLELANLYTYQKRFAEAITIYKKLIEDDAVTHPAYLDLALCQYLNKEYKDVIESCKKFIEKDTENVPEPYKWMAVSAARLNNYKEAESYCKKAIELNVKSQKEIFYFVAAAYSLMNKSEEALLNLEKALKEGMSIEDLEKDSEFNNIRSLQQYKDLIKKYK